MPSESRLPPSPRNSYTFSSASLCAYLVRPYHCGPEVSIIIRGAVGLPKQKWRSHRAPLMRCPLHCCHMQIGAVVSPTTQRLTLMLSWECPCPRQDSSQLISHVSVCCRYLGAVAKQFATSCPLTKTISSNTELALRPPQTFEKNSTFLPERFWKFSQGWIPKPQFWYPPLGLGSQHRIPKHLFFLVFWVYTADIFFGQETNIFCFFLRCLP